MSSGLRARTLLLASLLLLLTVPAAEARPGDGALSFPADLHLEGPQAITSGQLALLLTGDAPAATLVGNATSVAVTTVTYDVTRNPTTRVSRSDVRHETRELSASEVQLTEAGKEAILFLWSDALETGRFETMAGTYGAVKQKTLVPSPWWVLAKQEAPTDLTPDVFTYRADRQVEALAPHGTARLAGDLHLYLRNASLSLETSEGTVPLASRATREDTAPGVVEIHRFTYYVLTLRGATLDFASEAPVAAYSAAPLVEVDGALTSPLARGQLRVMDDTYPVEDAPLRVEGAFTLRPTVVTEDPTVGSDAEKALIQQRPQYTTADTRLQGDITAISVAARRVDVPESASTVPLALGGGAALVLFFLYFAPLMRYELTAALLPLYHRIREPQVLENEVRSNIYGIIRTTPGISARALHRASGQSWGTVVYHLRQLERNHLVKSQRVGRSRNFYENHGKYSGMEREIAVLNAEKSVRLAHAICQAPGISQEALTAQSGLPQSTISYYVRKLKEAELIEERRVGKYATYYPTASLPAVLLIINTPFPAAT